MKFLLQTINGKVTLDFVFALERNIEYQKWKGIDDIDCIYAELDDIVPDEKYNNLIPVGTVEFVKRYIYYYINQDALVRPLNVPSSLMKYRHGITNVYLPQNDVDPADNTEWFIKSNTIIKAQINGKYTTQDFTKLTQDYYQVSKIQDDIMAEYRCFIHHNKLIDCRLYSGDCRYTPNYDKIDSMITDFNYDYPYTLDVFVNEKGITQVMECHDFWSVGLYGFDYTQLAYMFSQAWFKLKNDMLNQMENDVNRS